MEGIPLTSKKAWLVVVEGIPLTSCPCLTKKNLFEGTQQKMLRIFWSKSHDNRFAFFVVSLQKDFWSKSHDNRFAFFVVSLQKAFFLFTFFVSNSIFEGRGIPVSLPRHKVFQRKTYLVSLPVVFVRKPFLFFIINYISLWT